MTSFYSLYMRPLNIASSYLKQFGRVDTKGSSLFGGYHSPFSRLWEVADPHIEGLVQSNLMGGRVDKQWDSNPYFLTSKIHILICDSFGTEIPACMHIQTYFSLQKDNNKVSLLRILNPINYSLSHLPTWRQVLISLVLEITPNSSTLDARNIAVGAKRRGSTHLKEFRA